MMAVAELIQLIIFSTIGRFVGLTSAMLSFRLQQKTWGVGFVALIFNGLPFLMGITFWIKISLSGI